MSKRTLMMVVALVAALALAATGTLAYLTDTDSDVNVMTLGNVDIEQIELQRSEVYQEKWDKGGYSFVPNDGDLIDFANGKPLYPAYPTPGGTGYELTDDRPADYYLYVTAQSGVKDPMWRNDQLAGVQDKFVFVENTGNSDAYVRTLLAFECPEGITYGTDENADLILNLANDPDNLIWADHGNIELNEKTYMLKSATYVNALEPGKISRPSLLQVVMSHLCGNEEVALLGPDYEILTLSQAIQVENLTELGAAAALDAGFGEVTKENAEKWFTDEITPASVDVTTGAEINEALEEGLNVRLPGGTMELPSNASNGYGKTAITQFNGGIIDGNGTVIKASDSDGTWDSAITTSGGKITGLRIAEGFRGVFVNSNKDRVYLENVIFDGTTYTIHCDSGSNGGLTASGCTFNGWTSYAGTIGDVLFKECDFGEGAGNAYCRPYAPTVFDECEFEAGFVIDPVADIVLDHCTLDGEKITDANVGDLVTNVSKVTIK